MGRHGMSTTDPAGTAAAGGDLVERRVAPLELFFDLVFVFALTQVTGFLADHLTWTGMLQGAALLAVLWWAWAGYAWLTNAVPAEEAIGARLVILTAMAAMLVASLAVPDAFGEDGVLFGVAYFVVRLLHIPVRARHRQHARGALDHPQAFAGLPGRPSAAHPGRVRGRLHPGHALGLGARDRLGRGFRARRRGPAGPRGAFRGALRPRGHLALGESIVAVGVGASGLALGAGVVAAAVFGVALAAGLWWAYFDLAMLVAERRLFATKGEERARLARDAYAYLHLPMVAGVVLVALGTKTTLAHVGDPLGTISAVALCGGVALYLLGHNAFRLRAVGGVSVPRLAATVLCLALIPAAASIPSLPTLATLAVLLCTLAAFETARSREFRRELRRH